MLQPLGMFLALEDHPPIGTLALEYGARIVQPMGQDVNFGVRTRNELSVAPDHACHLVERHRHGGSSVSFQRRSERSPFGSSQFCVEAQVSIWLGANESAIEPVTQWPLRFRPSEHDRFA